MSNAHSSHAEHGHAGHGSMKSYVIGFVLSLILTALSFGAVMSGALPHGAILPAIVILAVAQLVVQLFYFMHLGSASERDNTAIFIFTGLIIAIVVAGSLWVMHNANVNMMPTHMSTNQAMTHN